MIRRFFGRFHATLPLKGKYQTTWNFDYYYRHSRMLSKAQPGDLIFFGKITSPDAYEQAILDVVPGNLFHVAIVINALNVIHAASDGVVEEALDIVIKKQAPHFVELCRVDLPSSIKLQAVSKALSYLGAPYNDLFIPNNVTPDGERTFYCSELITDVYSEMDMHFPEHTLQFGSGDTLKYWEKFYKERGRQLPLDEPGSHPSQVRRSSKLEQLLLRDLRRDPVYSDHNQHLYSSHNKN